MPGTRIARAVLVATLAALSTVATASLTPSLEVHAIVTRVDGQPADLEVADGGVLRSGDRLQVHVQAPRDGFVYVVAYGSSGNAILLHPFGGDAADARVEAGKKKVVPAPGVFLPLDSRPGRELLFGIWSETPLQGLRGLLERMETAGGDAERAEQILRSVFPEAGRLGFRHLTGTPNYSLDVISSGMAEQYRVTGTIAPLRETVGEDSTKGVDRYAITSSTPAGAPPEGGALPDGDIDVDIGGLRPLAAEVQAAPEMFDSLIEPVPEEEVLGGAGSRLRAFEVGAPDPENPPEKSPEKPPEPQSSIGGQPAVGEPRPAVSAAPAARGFTALMAGLFGADETAGADDAPASNEPAAKGVNVPAASGARVVPISGQRESTALDVLAFESPQAAPQPATDLATGKADQQADGDTRASQVTTRPPDPVEQAMLRPTGAASGESRQTPTPEAGDVAQRDDDAAGSLVGAFAGFFAGDVTAPLTDVREPPVSSAHQAKNVASPAITSAPVTPAASGSALPVGDNAGLRIATPDRSGGIDAAAPIEESTGLFSALGSLFSAQEAAPIASRDGASTVNVSKRVALPAVSAAPPPSVTTVHASIPASSARTGDAQDGILTGQGDRIRVLLGEAAPAPAEVSVADGVLASPSAPEGGNPALPTAYIAPEQDAADVASVGDEPQPARVTASAEVVAAAASRIGEPPPTPLLSGPRPAAVVQAAGLSGLRETEAARVAAGAVVMVVTPGGSGSGALVDSAGHVLTNWHTVDGYTNVSVLLKQPSSNLPARAQPLRARVVRYNRFSDLALLRLESMPGDLRPLSLGAGRELREGDLLHAIGQPDGTWMHAPVVVTRVKPDGSWYSGQSFLHKGDLVTARTEIDPGGSGAALLNARLQLVALGAAASRGADRLDAVSVTTIRRFLAAGAPRAVAAGG